jgi:hypothetical protein
MRPIRDLLPRAKRLWPLWAAALLAICLVPGPARAVAPSIVVDGYSLPADVPALVSGDHVLVPLRGVFERLGAKVDFDPSTQTASASLNGMMVQVVVDSRTAHVNGAERTLEVGAREVAGRVMIPLRFVAQSLGVSVDYDEASNTVVIVSGQRPGNFAAMVSGPDLTVPAKAAPNVEDERPTQGELIGSQYPSIYARFAGGSSAVTPTSVRLSVDGADVTDAATISSAYISYTPNTPLLTGQHTVAVTGSSDDGTTFSSSWAFRVDAGSSADYTTGTYSAGYSGSLGWGGAPFGGFGGFGRFGFSPPGFSVFTPGPLFFVSGNIIEVIFVSRFFPFGNAFFNISGFPGTFALSPWLGNPGFFWGFCRVPFGVTARNAVIAARFTTPDGHHVVVHSTAPMQIEGERTSLPASLHYAVMPHLIGRPDSPRHLVYFRRVDPGTNQAIRPGEPGTSGRPPAMHIGNELHPGHNPPVISHPGQVTTHPTPVVVHPVIHPVIRPEPGFGHPAPVVGHPVPVMEPMPLGRPPTITQWQIVAPARPEMPVVPIKPKR